MKATALIMLAALLTGCHAIRYRTLPANRYMVIEKDNQITRINGPALYRTGKLWCE